MKYEKWLAKGLKAGWIAEPVCSTHDCVPNTEDEDWAWAEGDDPCIVVLRVWP